LIKRAWIALAVVALFAAVPASAAAKHPRPAVKNAAKYCKAQRSQMGATAFGATYGGKKNAFGKCVKKRVHDLNALRRAAVQQCKQELGAQGARWRNDSGSHGALRKCVNDKTQQQDQDNQDAVINAVRSCLTEHDADPAAFNVKYGVDGSAREAFGRCIREQLSQDSGDGQSEPGDDNSGDQTEPSAPEE
jgi:hypothetical protein